MLVIEGSPGAGKTTLLGRLLESLPETLVVFPEAQPPPALRGDAQVLRALLAEDRARIEGAAHLKARYPTAVVTSDRCHIGVLAYRYALVKTGRAAREIFDQALATVEEFRLGEGHRFDTVLILRLDPAHSLHRRAAHAHDARYRLWYDPEFLGAYHDFLDHLPRWTPVGAGWAVCDATDPASWSSLLPTPAPATRPRADARVSRDACGCAEPRSALVSAHGVLTQLYTSALHRYHPDGTLRCLRGAQEITADWLAASDTPIGRQR